MEFSPRRPEGRETGYEQNAGKCHANPRSVEGRPADRRHDEEIDRRIFKKVDAIGEQRTGANGPPHGELNPEIGEIQDRDDPNDSAQRTICYLGRHAMTLPTHLDGGWPGRSPDIARASSFDTVAQSAA